MNCKIIMLITSPTPIIIQDTGSIAVIVRNLREKGLKYEEKKDAIEV